MNFLSADVPDPTDFPPPAVAPGLRILDASFRCDICGELYDAPVTIACGHCFCSTCIRTSLSNKHECPSCRKATDEAHIRPNPALESVISSWKVARPFILKLIKRDEEYKSIQLQESDRSTSRKRKRNVSPSHNSSPSRNAPGPSSRPPVSQDMHKPPSQLKKEKPKPNRTLDLNIIPSSDGEEVELSIPSSNDNAPKDDELVSCPICQKSVIYRSLNTHIDNGCKEADTAAKSWSLLMGGGSGKNARQKGKHKKKASDSDDEYPLPLTTYTTLKDKQLKDMLSEHDLPTSGDRSIWEQRHRRWITLFNANLDKSIPNRKTKADLRIELKKWETDELPSKKKKKKVFTDVKKYQIEQKSEFDRLIEAARPKNQTIPGKDVRNTVTLSNPSRQTPTLMQGVNIMHPLPRISVAILGFKLQERRVTGQILPCQWGRDRAPLISHMVINKRKGWSSLLNMYESQQVIELLTSGSL